MKIPLAQIMLAVWASQKPAHGNVSCDAAHNGSSKDDHVNCESGRNTTSNEDSSWLVPSLAMSLVALSMLAMGGNAVVVRDSWRSFVRTRAGNVPRPCASLLMANLALADFGCGLFVMPASLHALIHGAWVMGTPVCLCICALNYCFIIVAMGTLGIISLDRCLAVWRAADYRQLLPWKRAAQACGLTWFSGIIFGCVPAACRWVWYDREELICTIRWDQNFRSVITYTLSAFFVCFFGPICIITTSYIVMLVAYHRNAFRKNDNNKTSRRLAKMALVMVAAYLMCYTPFALTKVLKVANGSLDAVPAWLSTTSSFAAYVNSAINPIIYRLLGRSRRVAKKVDGNKTTLVFCDSL
ncbi:beta-1 adrenergic receptor-like [Lethenteron reissneri]|uniref:beta-1 adrenergic receptor-like n=1 Tax=Lethenteron reissneri TaxID=7753 RepID=UPI002AB73714|nr:beta-1 adrenergic receptor-like [Lethenteron reissneri]